jgi:acetyl-CoA C-acetyltransferase
MSNIEHYSCDVRCGRRSGAATLHDRLDRGRERSQLEWRFGKISGMVETAENLASKFSLTRHEADEFAVRSHQRAAAAWERGGFDDEVIPVEVPQRKGEALTISRDEGIRADTSVAKLESLRPITPGGTVTAGNALNRMMPARPAWSLRKTGWPSSASIPLVTWSTGPLLDAIQRRWASVWWERSPRS